MVDILQEQNLVQIVPSNLQRPTDSYLQYPIDLSVGITWVSKNAWCPIIDFLLYVCSTLMNV